MKTVLILAASLLLASVTVAVALRVLQWIVTAICYALSVAIDLFREITSSVQAINLRLCYLANFIYRASNMMKHKIKSGIRRKLRSATPTICNSLTLLSWMLSRASHTVYLRYHSDNRVDASGIPHLTGYDTKSTLTSHGISVTL